MKSPKPIPSLLRGAALFVTVALSACSSDTPNQPQTQKRPSGPTSIELVYGTNFEAVRWPNADAQVAEIPDRTQYRLFKFNFVIHCGDTSFTPTYMEASSALPLLRSTSSSTIWYEMRDKQLAGLTFPITFRYTGKDGGDTSSRTVNVQFAPDVFHLVPRPDTATAGVGDGYGFRINITTKYDTPIEVSVYDSIADSTLHLKRDEITSGFFFWNTVPPGKPAGVYGMKIMLSGKQAIGDTGFYCVKVMR